MYVLYVSTGTYSVGLPHTTSAWRCVVLRLLEHGVFVPSICRISAQQAAFAAVCLAVLVAVCWRTQRVAVPSLVCLPSLLTSATTALCTQAAALL